MMTMMMVMMRMLLLMMMLTLTMIKKMVMMHLNQSLRGLQGGHKPKVLNLKPEHIGPWTHSGCKARLTTELPARGRKTRSKATVKSSMNPETMKTAQLFRNMPQIPEYL